MIWAELGVSGGTAPIVPYALHFVVKRAARNGVMEARSRIAGEKKGGIRALWEAITSEETAYE